MLGQFQSKVACFECSFDFSSMCAVKLVCFLVPLVNFEPIPVPRVRYSTSLPIPAPRKVITPAPPATPKPRDLEEIRTKYVKKINEMFDTLIERFQQLDL